MIGYMVQNVGAPVNWSVGKEDMSMQGIVFSQEIPFPGKLSTMGHAAGKMAEREHENAREMRLRVLAELRNAYYEYYLAYRSSEILTRTKDLMQNVQQIAETRYGTGQGMQQDVLRAQLEVLMLLDKIAEEERKTETQAAMINSLVGRDPVAPLGRPAELPPVSLEKSARTLLPWRRPIRRCSRENSGWWSRASSRSLPGRRSFCPIIVLSGGWFTRGDKSDVWQASVMFKVPLYFWNKSTGVKAADAELHSSRYDLRRRKAHGPGPGAGALCHCKDLGAPSSPLRNRHHTAGDPGAPVHHIELPGGEDRFLQPPGQPEPSAQVSVDGAGGDRELCTRPFP